MIFSEDFATRDLLYYDTDQRYDENDSHIERSYKLTKYFGTELTHD